MNNSSYPSTECDFNECEIIFDENSTGIMIPVKKQTYLERSLGFLIIGIIGVLSNLFVIIVLSSSVKIRQKLVNTLIIHQSVVDMLASIALIGTTHLDGSQPHGLKSSILANLYCFFAMALVWTLMNISSFSLLFLNIERYIRIVFPIYHHTNVTRRKVLMFLPSVWVLGILEQTLNGLGLSASKGTCEISYSSFRTKIFVSMGIVFVVAHFFLPVLLVLFLYGHMMIRLKTSTKSKSDSAAARRNYIMEKAKKNVFKTMLLITVCYAVCYVFNSIYSTLNLLGVLKTLAGKRQWSFPLIQPSFVKLTQSVQFNKISHAW